MKNRKQPSVDTCARGVLRAPLERAYAGGLNQFFSKISVARQYQAITPKTRQMSGKLLANVAGGNDFALNVQDSG